MCIQLKRVSTANNFLYVTDALLSWMLVPLLFVFAGPDWFLVTISVSKQLVNIKKTTSLRAVLRLGKPCIMNNDYGT